MSISLSLSSLTSLAIFSIALAAINNEADINIEETYKCVDSIKKQEDTNKVISEAVAWITANRDIILKVEEVSEHLGYNADYISRLFKANYGKSLKEYINDVKISHIKQLLLTSNLSLTDIACSTGFDDYKYFLKFFKYHEGVTPTQFLKSYTKTHINNK